MKEFNINESILVKMYDKGFEVWREYYNLPEMFRDKLPDNRPSIKELKQWHKSDKEGYYKIQLWIFMNIFGGHVGNGINDLFDMNILI